MEHGHPQPSKYSNSHILIQMEQLDCVTFGFGASGGKQENLQNRKFLSNPFLLPQLINGIHSFDLPPQQKKKSDVCYHISHSTTENTQKAADIRPDLAWQSVGNAT